MFKFTISNKGMCICLLIIVIFSILICVACGTENTLSNLPSTKAPLLSPTPKSTLTPQPAEWPTPEPFPTPDFSAMTGHIYHKDTSPNCAYHFVPGASGGWYTLVWTLDGYEIMEDAWKDHYYIRYLDNCVIEMIWYDNSGYTSSYYIDLHNSEYMTHVEFPVLAGHGMFCVVDETGAWDEKTRRAEYEFFVFEMFPDDPKMALITSVKFWAAHVNGTQMNMFEVINEAYFDLENGKIYLKYLVEPYKNGKGPENAVMSDAHFVYDEDYVGIPSKYYKYYYYEKLIVDISDRTAKPTRPLWSDPDSNIGGTPSYRFFEEPSYRTPILNFPEELTNVPVLGPKHDAHAYHENYEAYYKIEYDKEAKQYYIHITTIDGKQMTLEEKRKPVVTHAADCILKIATSKSDTDGAVYLDLHNGRSHKIKGVIGLSADKACILEYVGEYKKNYSIYRAAVYPLFVEDGLCISSALFKMPKNDAPFLQIKHVNIYDDMVYIYYKDPEKYSWDAFVKIDLESPVIDDASSLLEN